MKTTFPDWLQDELRKRGWSQADLARAAGVPRQVISTYINRRRKNPSPEVLLAIAKALDYSPEFIFRKAGLLPPDPNTKDTDASIDELVAMFRKLPKEDRERAIRIIRVLSDVRKQLRKKEDRESEV